MFIIWQEKTLTEPNIVYVRLYHSSKWEETLEPNNNTSSRMWIM